jgi:hypothetical protein
MPPPRPCLRCGRLVAWPLVLPPGPQGLQGGARRRQGNLYRQVRRPGCVRLRASASPRRARSSRAGGDSSAAKEGRPKASPPFGAEGSVADQLERVVEDRTHASRVDLRALASVQRVEVLHGDRVAEPAGRHPVAPAADDRRAILGDIRCDLLLGVMPGRGSSGMKIPRRVSFVVGPRKLNACDPCAKRLRAGVLPRGDRHRHDRCDAGTHRRQPQGGAVCRRLFECVQDLPVRALR